MADHSSVRKRDLLAELLDLPREDRLEVLHELLESLEHADADADGEPDMSPAVEAEWMVEIRRRHQEVLDGTAKLKPWEEVRSRLLGD